MGIRNLNRYLRDNCKSSIRCINMADLSGKRIAIDISIYLYKYEADNALLENMYSMLSIFRHYNIIPIFIFDGKPPPEKKALLIKRRENREDAQTEYNKLKKQLENRDDNEDNHDIIVSMAQLKQTIVQLKKEQIEKVKSLIIAYGSTYYDAPGEADELCALLVIKKNVWACLSEDMDMFVYGCTRVLRYFSLISHTAVLYYTKGILEELNMSQTEFKEICVLSGTDYNINADGNTNKVSLKITLKYFDKFRQSCSSGVNTNFYDWLTTEHCNYITDITLLRKINSMFSVDNNNGGLNRLNDIKIVNKVIQKDDIKLIMKEEDFIFIS